MGLEDREIRILADLDRAHPLVDAELLRGIDRHHLERLVFGDAAVTDRLRGLPVETSRQFVGVGVERDEHAVTRHDRGVIGDRVVGLHLVGPPVGEGRSAGPVLGDLGGDLVALEHVLEGGDLEAHLVRDVDEHQDFIGAVRVRVDETLAFQNLLERLHLQVFPWSRRRLRRGRALDRLLRIQRLHRRFVVVPLLLVGLGLEEGVAERHLDAHARRRIPLHRAGRARELGVLAERELDPRRRSLEQQGVA